VATRGEARVRATDTLRRAGAPTPALDADVLLAHVLGLPKETLVAHPEVELTSDEVERFDVLVAKRADGTPVAYLRGFKEFYGLRFAVDPRVLVPRPETEVLVEAVRSYAGGRALTVVDLGTGSGAIAIALAVSDPTLRLIATDVSAAALAVARTNAATHGARIDFRQGDLLGPITERVDVVVANLPYLRDDAFEQLVGDRTSLAFEPRVATAAGRDGLALVRHAIADLDRVLAPHGAAFFECDPPQSNEIAALLSALGVTDVIRDLAGLDRVVGVRRG
jgi:release factor glutamine methyltransferase